MALTNPPGVPVDDVAGLEIVRQWREQVWRNAERLVNAKDDAERAAVAADIQAYAAQWAEGSRRRLSQGPGHRGTRTAPNSSAAEPRLFRPVGLRTCVRVRSRPKPEGQRR